MTVASAIGIVIAQSVWALIQRLLGFAPEIFSPKVRIKQADINYTYDVSTHSGILTVKNLPTIYTTTVQDTNSMDGLLDYGHIVLMTKDFTIDDLAVGDTIIYKYGKGTIIHQIAYIGKDGKGLFFICKGVNCFYPDPFAVRPSQVVSLMRGIQN